MSSSDPNEKNLTGPDAEHLRRLEAIAQRNLDTYIDVGNALASIRDQRLYRETHDSFEAYTRDRWGISDPGGFGASLLRALTTIAGEDGAADVRITIRKGGEHAEPAPAPTPPISISRLVGDEGPPRLRWLLTQANGMLAAVAHRLEARSALLGEGARERLRDDVLDLEEELLRVKALLVAPLDWDTEYDRLLRGEIPPFDDGDDAGE